MVAIHREPVAAVGAQDERKSGGYLPQCIVSEGPRRLCIDIHWLKTVYLCEEKSPNLRGGSER
jgi:hypothetical protein